MIPRRTVPALVSALSLASSIAACGSGPDDDVASNSGLAAPDTACPSTVVYGLDVSNYQGASIDWAGVKSKGAAFGIAKATEGLTVDDADFKTNWANMKSAGMVRGAYHFFHGDDDGKSQADVFLAQVGTMGEPGDLPPFLDWEDDGNSGVTNAVAITNAQAFVDEIKIKTGLSTVIYTYPSFWEGLGSPAQFARESLWLANYSTCNVIAPWSGWSFLQYAGDATLTTSPINPYYGPADGGGYVNGEDLDEFNGSASDLRGWSSPPAAQVTSNSALALVGWPDEHVEIFGRAPSGSLLESATSGGGDSWSAQATLASGVSCGAAAAFWGAPGLYPELFAPTESGATGDVLWSGGSWNPLQSFGGSGFTNLTTLVGNDGLARVFALGPDGAIWFNRWSPASGAWAGWTTLGAPGGLAFTTGAAPITWGNGTLEIFAVDGAHTLWHRWTEPQETDAGLAVDTVWAPWTQLGAAEIASQPVAVRWPDGALGHAEVFARGLDGNLYHSEFSTSAGWPAPTAISSGTPLIGQPSAFMNPAGAAQSGPEVLARDTGGHVVHLARSGAGYTALRELGAQVAASDPLGFIRGDGLAEVFAVDESGALVRTLRSAGGAWSAWSPLGGGYDPCAPPLSTGMDAGTDAGADAGTDPGADAGADAGVDAGTHDAGTDAGSPDAGHGGGADAGSNPGSDAGQSDGGSGSGGSGGCDSSGSGWSGAAGLAFALLLLRRKGAWLGRSGDQAS